ncbi:MAG: YcxB family protein [Acidobacteria bacterium]|nr:YcxB family protein [Acidobacteriota bacterium]
MSELITLRFTYTEDEFVEAWQFYAMRAILKKSDVIVSLAVMGFSLLMTSLNGANWIWESLFVVGFLLLMGNVIGYFVMPRQRFRREPKYQEEYHLAFSEQGIHFKTTHAESKLEWAMYDKMWIVPRHYLLFYGRDLFTIIPQRVFTDNEQEHRFRELAQRKLAPAMIQIFA